MLRLPIEPTNIVVRFPQLSHSLTNTLTISDSIQSGSQSLVPRHHASIQRTNPRWVFVCVCVTECALASRRDFHLSDEFRWDIAKKMPTYKRTELLPHYSEHSSDYCGTICTSRHTHTHTHTTPIHPSTPIQKIHHQARQVHIADTTNSINETMQRAK